MSDNNFLKAYSDKIKALQTNDGASGSDWDQLENRMNHLDRQRKRRYVFFFLLLGLGFVLGGNYLYELNSSTTKKDIRSVPFARNIKNNEREEIKSSSEFNGHLKPNVENTETVQSNSSDNIKEAVGEGKDVHPQVIYSQPKYHNKVISQNAINSQKGINELKEKSPLDNPSGIENMQLFDLKDDNANQVEAENNISELNLSFINVENLKSKEIQIIEQKNDVNIGFPSVIPTPIKRMKYFVKIDGGPIITIHSGAPEMMAGMLNFSTHTMSKEIGMQTGLSLQLVPNEKWKFGLGVNRSYLIHHASHTASLRLMDGICLNPDSPDPKEYAFSYNVTNGRSSSTINLRLSEENQGTPLDSTEVFNIEMGMHKETVSWAIPITAERVIYTKGDWSVFAKGGLNFGVSSYSNETITHFSESCANLCFNHGFSPSVLNQKSNQITTGIILGMSVEWLLSPRMRLVMNPEINVVMMMPNEYHNNHTKWGINLGGMYQIK